MSRPIASIDFELAQQDGQAGAQSVGDYSLARVLIRLNGSPVDSVDVPIDVRGEIQPEYLRACIGRQARLSILQNIAVQALDPRRSTSKISDRAAVRTTAHPHISVIVCTRNRSADLAQCLSALIELDDPSHEIIVVDNAPSDPSTKDLIESFFPGIRYVLEPRPGLDWARNCGVLAARGDIVAFTDDDVIVDKSWLRGLAGVFDNCPDVMCVMGLVIPHELETEAQQLFETYGGFSRGYVRRWCRIDGKRLSAAARWFGTGQFGTGANMAYRKEVFQRIGLFDPALDVGTVTNGGGDIEMMFRVIKNGETLAYEPAAIVRHRHRRTLKELCRQVSDNSSFFTVALRSIRRYPDETFGIVKLALTWFWQHNVKRYIGSFRRRYRFPREIIVSEIKASVTFWDKYDRALANATAIVEQFGPQPTLDPPAPAADSPVATRHPRRVIAKRAVSLDSPLSSLDDVASYARTQVHVSAGGQTLGDVLIENAYAPLSALRLCDAIALKFPVEVATLYAPETLASLHTEIARTLTAPKDIGITADRYSIRPVVRAYPMLPENIGVSIVVAAPAHEMAQLPVCLKSLEDQQSGRAIEVIVARYAAPGSHDCDICDAGMRIDGATLLPAIAEGAMAARLEGLRSAANDIVVFVDSDLTAAPDWLESLLSPLNRRDIGLVTGGIDAPHARTEQMQAVLDDFLMDVSSTALPRELSERWFRDAKRPVEVWRLGSLGNAAVRIAAARDLPFPDDAKTLGAEIGSECGDCAFFAYQVLSQGWTVLRHPAAAMRRAQPTPGREQSLACTVRQEWLGRTASALTIYRCFRDIRIWEYFGMRMPGLFANQIRRSLARRNRSAVQLILAALGGAAGAFLLYGIARQRRRQAPQESPAGLAGEQVSMTQI